MSNIAIASTNTKLPLDSRLPEAVESGAKSFNAILSLHDNVADFYSAKYWKQQFQDPATLLHIIVIDDYSGKKSYPLHISANTDGLTRRVAKFNRRKGIIPNTNDIAHGQLATQIILADPIIRSGIENGTVNVHRLQYDSSSDAQLTKQLLAIEQAYSNLSEQKQPHVLMNLSVGPGNARGQGIEYLPNASRNALGSFKTAEGEKIPIDRKILKSLNTYLVEEDGAEENAISLKQAARSLSRLSGYDGNLIGPQEKHGSKFTAFIASGSSSYHVNMLAVLAQNVAVTPEATNGYIGKKLSTERVSSPATVGVYEPYNGKVSAKALPNEQSYDIDNDGLGDIKYQNVPYTAQEQSIIARFNNQPISEKIVASRVEASQLLNENNRFIPSQVRSDKLYSLQDLAEVFGFEPLRKMFLGHGKSALGVDLVNEDLTKLYAYIQLNRFKNVTGIPSFFLLAQKEGVIVLPEQLDSTIMRFVSSKSHSSFATPNALRQHARDILQSFDRR